MDYPLSPAVVILLGAALLASPVFLFPHLGELECGNDIESLDANAGSTDDVREYEQLSEDAQRAFDRALASEDDRATVYGDRCPEEFSYSDWCQHHTIRKNDTDYRLRTYHAGSAGFGPDLDQIKAAVLVIIGTVFCPVGLGLFIRARR